MNNQTPSTAFTLESTAQILIRCFWIGFASIFLWFCGFMATREWSYEISQQLWPGLTQHEADLVNLCGIGLLKLVVFVGFLLPYLSIRLVLKGKHT